MTPFTFLDNKYTPTLLPHAYAPREKLLKKFDIANKNSHIYVCAPVGSGKSFSSLLWLTHARIQPIWLCLDEYDNILQVFYKQLAHALLQTQEHNLAAKKILASSSFTANPITNIQLFISELYLTENSYALVFDDLHNIKNKKILVSLPTVLRRLPLNYSILFLSNHDLPDELKTEHYNEDSIITFEDLAFTKEEIRELFTKKEKEISSKEIDKIHSMSEGLAIGVTVFANAPKLHLKNNISLMEYFEKYVWNSWSSKIRFFCISICVLDDFDVDLAERLSNDKDALNLLTELVQNNEFVTKKNETTYRVHRLFRMFLRYKLATKNLQNKKITLPSSEFLYMQVTQYFKEKDIYYKALSYVIHTQDYKEMEQCLNVYLSKRELTLIDEIDFLDIFFQNDFPSELYENVPTFHLLALKYYAFTGQKEESIYHRRKIFELDTCDEEIADFLLWTIYLDNTLSLEEKLCFYEEKKIINEGEISRKGDRRHLHFISLHLPFAHRSILDFTCLFISPEYMEKLDTSYGKSHWGEWFFWRVLIMGFLALEQNNFEKAQSYYEEATKLVELAQCGESLFSYYVFEHSLLYFNKNYASANVKLRGLEEFSEKSAIFLNNFLAYKTRILLLDGDIVAAKVWFTYPFVTMWKNCKTVLLHIYVRFTSIRAFMALGEYDDAEKYILAQKEFFTGMHRPLDIAECHILLSIVYWKKIKKKEALSILHEAISMLMPYKALKIFIDESAALLPILKKLLQNTPKDDFENYQFIQTLIIHTTSFAKKHCGYINKSLRPIVPEKITLSRQQFRILSLLAQGYSNAEICDAINLKITTIKSHTAVTYKKLGVKNVRDAIEKAREYKLL